MKALKMKSLFEAGVHFGHLTRFCEPKMNPYIYGVMNKINIIDLEQTLPLFNNAVKKIAKIAGDEGGKILFVGTKRSAREIIAECAKDCGMPYVNYRWLGGMLTNYKTIRQSIVRLEEIKKIMEDGTAELLTKKERLGLDRELIKLENSLGGIKEMGGLPDALFIIDAGYEKIAIKEANRLRIPVFAVVDTNSSPDGVDHVVPGNDDSMRAIRLYSETIASVIKEAKDKVKAKNNTKFKGDFVEVKKEKTKNIKQPNDKAEKE